MRKPSMYFRKILPVCVVVLPVSGCGALFGPEGYFRDRGDDYLKAEPIAPLKLPSGVNSESLGQLFVIPPIADPDAPMPGEFEVPSPAGSESVAEQQNEVKIQKLGERRWITVNAAPGAVWPRVRGFLADRGLPVSVIDPSRGVFETDWLAIKDDPLNKDRYQIRLEPGLRSNTTEVHVLQMTVAEVSPVRGEVNWPASSMSAQREGWMINELSAFLAREDASQESMLAQAINSTGDRKVELVSGHVGEPQLRLNVDYARAWASVGGALGRDGFHIESSNRDQGLWQVSVSEEANGDDQSVEKQTDESLAGRFLRVFDFSGSGEKPVAGAGYRVLLQQHDSDSVRVVVRADDGQVLDRLDAEKLLRRIRTNLP